MHGGREIFSQRAPSLYRTRSRRTSRARQRARPYLLLVVDWPMLWLGPASGALGAPAWRLGGFRRTESPDRTTPRTSQHVTRTKAGPRGRSRCAFFSPL